MALVNRSKKVIKRIFEGARAGRVPQVAEVVPVVEDVADSIMRNAQALLGAIRIKTKDEYTYFHSIAVCTLMINMARRLDMDEQGVLEMGIAGLLHDIGKMGISDEVLNKPGRLTDDEFAMVREHPAHGHRILSDAPDMIEMALDVCLHHHEKMDGRGYPFGYDADKLSLAARAGAICDVYDALTSDRAYKEGWKPAEAVRAMWSWEGHFDPALMFTFMQSIGVFPAGMLVRLRSNRLGVVLENQRRASRPRACAFYDARTLCFMEPEIVTIRDDLAGDQIVAAEEPGNWGFTGWEEMAERLMRGEDPRLAA